MAVSLSTAKKFHRSSSISTERSQKTQSDRRLQWRFRVSLDPQKSQFSGRRVFLATGSSLIAITVLNLGSKPLPIRAEENELKEQSGDEEGKGILGQIQSFFDPNEKTKSGKVLPKSYLKSAREVVKTLRESLKEDAKDVAKFRRTADAAKESIREYLNGWKGKENVVAEESYVALEKAIRSLANFYSKAGPFAPLPEVVRSSVLIDLETAEASL